MYILAVPYEQRTDADGLSYRAPAVPARWEWSQVTSRLDTGRLARADRRLAVIAVRERRATVEAWAARQGAGALVRSVDAGDDVDVLWSAARQDGRARREFRSALRDRSRALIAAEESAEFTRRAAPVVLPFIVALGLAGAARLLATTPDTLLGITAGGVALMQEDCTVRTYGAGGDEPDGMTPNVLGSGTFRNLGTWGATGNSGPGFVLYSRNDSRYGFEADRTATGNRYVQLIYDPGSAIGNQYVEVPLCKIPLGRGGLIVRSGTTDDALTGYAFRASSANIRRIDSNTSQTVIGTGALTNSLSDNTLGPVRFEANGSTLDLYTADPTPTYTLDITATDSDYPTGVGGFLAYVEVEGVIADGRTHEWGSLPSAGPERAPGVLRTLALCPEVLRQLVTRRRI